MWHGILWIWFRSSWDDCIIVTSFISKLPIYTHDFAFFLNTTNRRGIDGKKVIVQNHNHIKSNQRNERLSELITLFIPPTWDLGSWDKGRPVETCDSPTPRQKASVCAVKLPPTGRQVRVHSTHARDGPIHGEVVHTVPLDNGLHWGDFGDFSVNGRLSVFLYGMHVQFTILVLLTVLIFQYFVLLSATHVSQLQWEKWNTCITIVVFLTIWIHHANRYALNLKLSHSDPALQCMTFWNVRGITD